jgi:hypothetical protein
VAKRCLINAINPTTHKHAVPALVGLFLGWVRAWDPTWAHCRCEMCDGGVTVLEPLGPGYQYQHLAQPQGALGPKGLPPKKPGTPVGWWVGRRPKKDRGQIFFSIFLWCF